MNVILKDAETLKYVPSKLVFCFQVGSTFLFLGLWILFGMRLFEARAFFSPLFFILAFLLAQCTADFLGGVLHWTFDTWGSNSSRFIGFAVRAFRHHHVDKYEITHHGIFRTSYGIACILIPLVLLTSLVSIDSYFAFTLLSFLLFFFILTFLTNVFHSWAHLDNPAIPIRILQKSHLILQNQHHDKHHTEPFNTSYCITNGWMNPVLRKIHFFPIVENIITKITGVIPRVDDIGIEAAKTIQGGK